MMKLQKIGGNQLSDEDVSNTFVSNEDYESPDEEEIQKKTANLEINTLEDTYDNTDIIEDKKNEGSENKEILEKFLSGLDSDSEGEGENSVVNDSSVVNDNEGTTMDLGIQENIKEWDSIEDVDNSQKVQEIANEETNKPLDETMKKEVDIADTDTKESFTNKTKKKNDKTDEIIVVKKMDVEETPVEETMVEKTPVEETMVEETRVEDTRVEDTPVEDTPVEETRVEETRVEDAPDENKDKKIIEVEKNESDDETIDEFFKDVTQMIEKKGTKVSKDPKKYTLFDDIIEE